MAKLSSTAHLRLAMSLLSMKNRHLADWREAEVFGSAEERYRGPEGR